MNFLRIWITLPDGETTELGELAFDEPRPNGTAPTAFRYASSWLERKDAFPINPDPQMLPLVATEFQASHLGPPLQALNDALPDDWGRRLIIAEQRLPRHQQSPYWIMRAVAGNSLGALSFSGKTTPPARTRSSHALADLATAAAAFDAHQPIEDAELKRLYAAGATPGGARPKALVAAHGGEWIAKFPSVVRDNGFDVVGLEATSLELARCAGLDVPESHLVDLGKRRALLIRRFDITPAGGRVHMLSLSTLCREAGGIHCQSYNDPAAAIRKFTDDGDDLIRFFRQMSFNAAIGNTDDHLKNFAMIRDERGYRLSPAFDLVPDIGRNGDHVMAMGHQFGTPSGGDLLDVGRQWFHDPARAKQIVEEVIGTVDRFRATAKEFGVTPDSVEFFAADIEKRIRKMRAGL
ncbi:MAG: type II toxin-antitoxin system HipA family toxin [Sulfuritalea sp.]|nr:type II toxin-antitoxin system HipA family toxin [Sulfuritalea sp.]